MIMTRRVVMIMHRNELYYRMVQLLLSEKRQHSRAVNHAVL